MAKYNFWVRTTKQTNHPMKGVGMELGECRQFFNDYLALLERHGIEVIDAEIYRIKSEAEVPADKAESCDSDTKPAETTNIIEMTREAIRSETEDRDYFLVAELMKYNDITQQILDIAIPALIASEEIVPYGRGFKVTLAIFKQDIWGMPELVEQIRKFADDQGVFCERAIPRRCRSNLRELLELGMIECTYDTKGTWRILPKMSPMAGTIYYKIKHVLIPKENPLSFKTLLAEIGEEYKPELQATLNELIELGLIKRLAGGKGGCRYDVTFKLNNI